jgi:putative GTP pyrophosphokinase
MLNFNPRDIERMAKDISSSLEDDLIAVGLFYRIIHRCKGSASIQKKISGKKYDGSKTFMRDIIGLRINLFFADDVDIVYKNFKSKFEFVEETIDRNETTEFKPTRLNVIFRIPKKFQKEFSDVITEKRIDNTFELQLRTILSEGWHEVDHDLRYKCLDDWSDHSDLSRMFNGILAALETNDWSILKLFEELSQRHYLSSNWLAMVKSKFRIRFISNDINSDLKTFIDGDNETQKQLFSINRNKFLEILFRNSIIIPFTMGNIILLLNYIFIKNEKILKMTPESLMKEFSAIK